jgi:hypothetical protein
MSPEDRARSVLEGLRLPSDDDRKVIDRIATAIRDSVDDALRVDRIYRGVDDGHIQVGEQPARESRIDPGT